MMYWHMIYRVFPTQWPGAAQITRPISYNNSNSKKPKKKRRRSNYRRVLQCLESVEDDLMALWDEMDKKMQEIHDDLIMIYNDLPMEEEG